MSMGEKFTENTRKALALAQEEAQGLGYNYVGTEHLLLGMVGVTDSPVAGILNEMGVSADDVRTDIIRLTGKGDYQIDDRFGYTPRTKNVIENAARVARQLGHNFVSNEHLMLALILSLIHI